MSILSEDHSITRGTFCRRGKRRLLAGIFLACSVGGNSVAFAADWSRFLGPEGKAASADGGQLPQSWSDTENLKWKAELPGLGVSSPIVIDGKVFVTSYSGYGVGADGEQIEDLKRHLTCFDAMSGKQLWNQTVDAVQPEDPYRPPGVTAHGYASHTPVSDGERVYVFFGKTGVIAFDLEGNELWRQSVGTGSGPQQWGSAASPILYDGGARKLLIVNASDESEALFAFDAASGEQVWKTEAGNLASTWSTPNLVALKGRTDLVLTVPGEVWGLNPETGKLRWFSRGTTDDSTSASPIAIGDTVIAVGGRSGDAVAVRAGGKGDVNDSHVLWDANIPGRFATPIAHEGHLFVYNSGVLSCYDAKTGERVNQQRLSQTRGGGPGGGGAPGGGRGQGGRGRGGERGGRGGFGDRRNMEYATPVLADGKLYVTAPGGEFYVVQATPEMELLQTNQLTDDTGFSASPAISNGRLYLRSNGALYCIGQ